MTLPMNSLPSEELALFSQELQRLLSPIVLQHMAKQCDRFYRCLATGNSLTIRAFAYRRTQTVAWYMMKV